MDLLFNSTSDNVTQNDGNVFRTMALHVVGWLTLSLGLPIICLAIYLLYFLIRADHVAPVYVINLLIADLLQIIMRLFMLLGSSPFVVLLISFYGLIASVGFMVCIALERYLAIVFPLWYRSRHNIKLSLIVSSVVWTIPFIEVNLFDLVQSRETALVLFAVLLLIPFPLLVFFLVGTLKALSGAISGTALDKRRIIGTLTLVLGNYALLFLPVIIQSLMGYNEGEVGQGLLLFSPLVDTLLYVFMKKGAKDTLLSCPCLDNLLATEQDQRQFANDVSAMEGSV